MRAPVRAHFLRVHYSTDCGQMILNFYEVDTESREKTRPILVKIYNFFRNTPMPPGKNARPLSPAESRKPLPTPLHWFAPCRGEQRTPRQANLSNNKMLRRAALTFQTPQIWRFPPTGDHSSPLQFFVRRNPEKHKPKPKPGPSGYDLGKSGKEAMRMMAE